MADVPFWTTDTKDKDEFQDFTARSTWDVVVFNGGTLPGIATVSVTSAMKVDEKKGAGKNGATPTFHGRVPAKFDVSLVIWTDDQLSDLQDQMLTWWPRDADKNQPKPRDIYHPNLAFLGIKSAYPVQVTGLDPGPTSKARTVRIHMQEFRKGKGKGKPVTPVASVPNRIAPSRLGGQSPLLLAPGDGSVLADNATPPKPSKKKSFTDPR